MTEHEKLDLRSHDIAEDKRQELLRLFPEIRTEGGKLDFERLKLVLGEVVDVGKERYGLTWPGKAECLKAIQTPSMGTLLPCREESVNFDTTENLIIEGDNLEVLKLLQKSYLGKVKLIYIDPPYNTGSDFIYPDNYSESLQTYLQYTAQVDDEGKRFGTNTEADGRFHSKWLSMMYPRLYMARNLLREDGVVFISIGEAEVGALLSLCDQVFGEENRLGVACRVAKKSNNKGDHWAPNFDYIATYARERSACSPFSGGVNTKAYDQIEADGPRKGERYQLVRLYMSTIENQNPEQRFWIDCPDGTKIIPPGTTLPPERPRLGDGIWRWTRKKFDAERDRIVIKAVRSSNLIDENGKPASWNVFTKTYLKDVIENSTSKPNNLVEDHINQIGSHEMTDLDIPFDYPKPSTLVRFLSEIAQTSAEDVVLDFFAGSGTTGHAVLDLNRQDGGRRKFILVQLPEPTRTQKQDGTWDETAAWKAGYHTIADITKERVRRVITKLNAEDSGKLDLDDAAKPDRGFRVFKLAESNFKPWNAEVPHEPGAVVTQLEAFVDHVRDTRGSEDLLYEMLLKSGFPLTAPVETLTLAQKSVYAIAGGAMLVCLERDLTLDLIRAIADRKPERVVCLDEGFAKNDQLKANAVQLFKTKGVAKFQTV